MKVIGAGFGRTGTSSLKVALEQLGFGPCYHMSEVFVHVEHIGLWEKAARGEHVDWQRLFEGYNATLDWPAAAFYERLLAAYPEAKVLLTVRDAERWYESTRETVYALARMASSSRIVAFSLELVAPIQQQAIRMIDTVVWQGVFGGRFEEKQQALTVFNRHIEQVKERVPAERLLIYDVKEGWGPLCAFLGVDVPVGTPFPHLHDSASVQKIVRQRVLHAARRASIIVAPVALAILLALRFLRGRRAPVAVLPPDRS